MPGEVRVLQEAPYLSVHGTDLKPFCHAQVTGLTVDTTEIAVNLEAAELPRTMSLTAMLATLGMSNRAIGGEMLLSEQTIKGRVTQIMEKTGLVGRTALTRYFFEKKVYEMITSSQRPVDFLPTEQRVIACASYGKTNQEIAGELNLSPLTVKSYLYAAARHTGWSGRGRLILAACAGGNIGNFAPNAEQE